MDIKAWLQKIASSFQPAYTKLDQMDFPPEIKKVINQVWLTLPVKIQAVIWELIKKLADAYGDEFAQKILKEVLEALKRVGND